MDNRIQKRRFRANTILSRALTLGTLALACSTSAQLPATIDLTLPPGSEGTQVTRVYGPPSVDGIGRGAYSRPLGFESRFNGGIAHGDFNGDGHADLVVGNHDVPNLVDPSFDNAGCVYIIFGGAGNLGTEVDLGGVSVGNQEARFYGQGFNRSNGIGRSLAAGDFNGDGCDDIVIGAIDYSIAPPPAYFDSEIYVFFGSPNLPGSVHVLPTEGVFVSDGIPVFLSIIGAHEAIEDLGVALAVGDFDGDGLDDIAAATTNSGARHTYVAFGNTIQSGEALLLDEFTTNHLQISGTFHAGFTLASGDIDGNGFDDIVLGDIQTQSSGGAWDAYVVYGGDSLVGHRIVVESAPGVALIIGEALPPVFADGRSVVAAGDIDGDGRDDVIVNSEMERIRTVTIIYAEDIVGNAVVDLNDPTQGTRSTRYTDDSHVSFATEDGPYLSAVGDINGDGLADILLGMPEFTPPRPGLQDVAISSMAPQRCMETTLISTRQREIFG